MLTADGASNVIPENASAKGDVRAVSREEFDRVERDLTRVSQNRLIPDTQVKTTLVRGLPPMPRTPQTDAPIKIAEAIFRRDRQDADDRRLGWCCRRQLGRR